MVGTEVTAGEVLEIGNLFYVKQMKAYRTTDARQVPRGVAPKHYDIGDVVDICIVAAILDGGIGDPDELLGYAGEDLVAGGLINRHADGMWYNSKEKIS